MLAQALEQSILRSFGCFAVCKREFQDSSEFSADGLFKGGARAIGAHKRAKKELQKVERITTNDALILNLTATATSCVQNVCQLAQCFNEGYGVATNQVQRRGRRCKATRHRDLGATHGRRYHGAISRYS